MSFELSFPSSGLSEEEGLFVMVLYAIHSPQKGSLASLKEFPLLLTSSRCVSDRKWGLGAPDPSSLQQTWVFFLFINVPAALNWSSCLPLLVCVYVSPLYNTRHDSCESYSAKLRSNQNVWFLFQTLTLHLCLILAKFCFLFLRMNCY